VITIFIEVNLSLTLPLFPSLRSSLDTKTAATFPHATEHADYSARRFGWELPNVLRGQLFQAVLTI